MRIGHFLLANLFISSVTFLLWAFGMYEASYILMVGTGILDISLFVTYAILEPLLIGPSRKVDEEIRSNKLAHYAVMANQRNQGLVLDMDAYYEGKEKYITQAEADAQKTLGHKFRKFVKDLKS